MDRVLDHVWIGAARDMDGTAPLRALGFVAVVDLRDNSIAPAIDPSLAVLRLGNRDGDPWNAKQIGEALDFIHAHVRKGRVLIACAAGMSRSVSIAIGYLVRCGWDPAAAYALVRQARPIAAPVESMLGSVLGALA